MKLVAAPRRLVSLPSVVMMLDWMLPNERNCAASVWFRTCVQDTASVPDAVVIEEDMLRCRWMEVL